MRTLTHQGPHSCSKGLLQVSEAVLPAGALKWDTQLLTVNTKLMAESLSISLWGCNTELTMKWEEAMHTSTTHP